MVLACKAESGALREGPKARSSSNVASPGAVGAGGDGRKKVVFCQGMKKEGGGEREGRPQLTLGPAQVVNNPVYHAATAGARSQRGSSGSCTQFQRNGNPLLCRKEGLVSKEGTVCVKLERELPCKLRIQNRGDIGPRNAPRTHARTRAHETTQTPQAVAMGGRFLYPLQACHKLGPGFGKATPPPFLPFASPAPCKLWVCYCL